MTYVAIAGAVASAASSAVSYASQASAADKQAKFGREQYAATAANAQTGFINDATQATTQFQQNREQAFQQGEQIDAQVREESGAMAANAADRGVEGNSVQQLMDDYQRIRSGASVSLNTNLSWLSDQKAEELKGYQAEAVSRLNAARPAPINDPSLLATGLSIGGTLTEGGVRAYSNYQQAKLAQALAAKRV